jgi:NADH-quinone oxidoreductase subunit F/NAD(P)H dehydrogenase (quinone)/NADP-reducing hydrogenase subunit HndC
VLNNVETLANVPRIILKGAGWYAGLGTENSKGTKVFCVSGCIKNIGLIEVPMGIPLSTIVNDICGGVKGRGRSLKAIQIGGPSGGCLPADLLETPVEFESITKTGAIMGSGGLVVMDNKSCMVDVAKFFLGFTADESCGKCTPCREGSLRLLEKLTDITEGRGREGDIEYLEDLSRYIIDSSLCGLGQTAPNPVLTTIRYFRSEYEAHIRDKKCPAKKCVKLLEFTVDKVKCTRCGLCSKACPAGAIRWEKKQPATIDKEKCTRCLSCYGACNDDAID